MYELIRDHGVVIGGTMALLLLTISFGLGWAIAAFCWVNPGLLARLRYVRRK